MRRFIESLGRGVGIYFTPDNYVTPIFRLGRYHRVKGPGFCWIVPLVDQALPRVKTSTYVGNFIFQEVLTKDNIPFSLEVTILFTFKPELALKSAAAQLVQASSNVLQTIVRDYANQGLRRLVARYEAQTLATAQVLTGIEHTLTGYLTSLMRNMGLAPLKEGGILIKQVLAPEKFKHTMLDVKHDEAILEVLRSYPVPELVQLLNQVIFANSLKDRSGQTALMMGMAEQLKVWPWPEAGHARSQNGHSS